jgi:HemY protein
LERLAAQNPEARETHLALAEAALDAQLWGEARRHLEQALSAPAPPFMARLPNPAPLAALDRDEDASLAGPTPRLCVMMARLEEADHGAGPAAREWLDRAVIAMPDPRYVCATCGGESLEWRSLCPHCGSFDALAWRTPAWAAAGSTLPILAKPLSAEERALPAELPAGHSASS